MQNPPLEPCLTSHLFRPLLKELLITLRGLSEEEWQRPTVAPGWRVRDVAAHLLDGDLRKIAVYRDAHVLPVDGPIAGERDLTAFINELNATGVGYAARLSPRLITDLLEITGAWVADLIESLPPHGRSIFAVSWAGEQDSENWMDTGREYTERWHHQMQIRDAASRPLLLTRQWMAPLLDISVRALPHACRHVDAPSGTAVALSVTGETTAAWVLQRTHAGWRLSRNSSGPVSATISMDGDTAWRVFYNAPHDRSRIRIAGDAALAEPLLRTRSVIV